jgi:PTH1 family peptidyl-tRNA hydrolase
MRILCGLGNPGVRYRNTWHNLGFMLLDRVAERQGLQFRSGRGSWMEARFRLAEQDILLLKPTTFMNLSGQALQEAWSYYKADPSEALVIFDDLDLPLGELRFRASGSGGNHNGMSHVVHVLGPEIPRLRLGFRPPMAVSSSAWKQFVLAPIPASVHDAVRDMLERAEEGTDCFLEKGVREAMNRFNRAAGGKED